MRRRISGVKQTSPTSQLASVNGQLAWTMSTHRQHTRFRYPTQRPTIPENQPRLKNSPRPLVTYRPKNPVAPNTQTLTPASEARPPRPVSSGRRSVIRGRVPALDEEWRWRGEDWARRLEEEVRMAEDSIVVV
jgi:hypothetical protein